MSVCIYVFTIYTCTSMNIYIRIYMHPCFTSKNGTEQQEDTAGGRGRRNPYAQQDYESESDHSGPRVSTRTRGTSGGGSAPARETRSRAYESEGGAGNPDKK